MSRLHAQALGHEVPKKAVIPTKADPEKQAEFLSDRLEPLLEEEQQVKRKVFIVDAAHFVMGAFLGMLWCFEQLFLKSSNGRSVTMSWGLTAQKLTT